MKNKKLKAALFVLSLGMILGMAGTAANKSVSLFANNNAVVAHAETKAGTITFGTNNVKISRASVTGTDSLNNTWTITTVGTTSYTANASYYQVGSSKSPATSITFTTTLSSEVSISALSIKLGGFPDTAGTVTLKVGDTTVGTGSLNGTTDVTTSSTTAASGSTITITITGISKGVKVYNISYSYENTTNTSTDSGSSSSSESQSSEITSSESASSEATSSISSFQESSITNNTVTYTVSSKDEVTTTGAGPTGSSATYSQTYSTQCQMTKENSATLTLSGYSGCTITALTLSMKSNKSTGSGTFSMTAGSTTLASISTATTFNKWYDNNSYSSSSYKDVNVTLTNNSYVIKDNEVVTIDIAATENSLYINSYKITYELSSSTAPQVNTSKLFASNSSLLQGDESNEALRLVGSIAETEILNISDYGFEITNVSGQNEKTVTLINTTVGALFNKLNDSEDDNCLFYNTDNEFTCTGFINYGFIITNIPDDFTGVIEYKAYAVINGQTYYSSSDAVQVSYDNGELIK